MNAQETTPNLPGFEPGIASFEQAASADEAVLVAQAKSGCSNSFGELYMRHRARIYRAAYRVLRNEQDAEDAVQRSFQRALTNLASFREDSTFLTWLTRIAINEALMLLRQKRRTTQFSESSEEEAMEPVLLEVADARPTPEQALAEHELREAVMQSVSRLRSGLQMVVLLRELQGLSNAETARRLGLTVGAVKARLFHARRCLKKHFERKYRGCRGSFFLQVRHASH